MCEIMDFLRNYTIRARGYTFSDSEMRSYRIKGVYNSMTDPDYLDVGYMECFIRGCYNPSLGEACISESAIRTTERGVIRILSVIVFHDEPSMEMFCFAHQGLYFSCDRTLNGRMN